MCGWFSSIRFSCSLYWCHIFILYVQVARYLIAVIFHPFFFPFYFHCASEYHQHTFICLSFFCLSVGAVYELFLLWLSINFLIHLRPYIALASWWSYFTMCFWNLLKIFFALYQMTSHLHIPIDLSPIYFSWRNAQLFFSSILKLRIKLPVHPGYYRPPANLENTTLLICIFNLWAMYFLWFFFFFFFFLFLFYFFSLIFLLYIYFFFGIFHLLLNFSLYIFSIFFVLFLHPDLGV